MTSVIQDTRFALRQLDKNRGFGAVAVLSLALGIGTTTAMFSLIYAVLLHPFPYAGPDRIMNPHLIDQQHPDEFSWFSLSKAQPATSTATPTAKICHAFMAKRF
jgi:hypothetical protein